MAHVETIDEQLKAVNRPLSLEIRPGVMFPEWDAVSSEQARHALSAIMEAFGAETCWKDFQSDEDRIRQSVLHAYPSVGHAPSLAELTEATGLDLQEVRTLLQKLRKRDLVVLSDDGERITGAYPFTENKTEHRVSVGDQTIYAMCAIDALGVGYMYSTDATIESSCRATGRPIGIATKNQGAQLESYEPGNAVVWSGIRPTHGTAANTLCTVLAFFSSDEALEKWRLEEHPDERGYPLSMQEGLEVGKAIFGPMLRAPSG